MLAAAERAYVALGSNLGDRSGHLAAARAALAALPETVVVAASAVEETAPLAGMAQPPYLNQMVLIETRLSPRELLQACQAIEQAQGRVRGERWGARTLDVDLVAYGEPETAGEVRSDASELTLPHPRAHERAFVLAPWYQVQPQARLRLPDGSVHPVAELLAAAADRDGVRPTSQDPLW